MNSGITNIKRVYIIDAENVLDSEIKIENNLITNIGLANKKKFIPKKWTYIFYDNLPKEFTIYENSVELHTFITNFNKKYTISGDLSVINYKEVISHWMELNNDEDALKNKISLKHVSKHRYKYFLNIRKIKNKWEFEFEKIPTKIILNLNEFISTYVSLIEYEIYDIELSFSNILTTAFDSNLIDNNKLMSYVNELIHKQVDIYNEILNNKYFDFSVEIANIPDNYINYGDNFIKCIKFRLKND